MQFRYTRCTYLYKKSFKSFKKYLLIRFSCLTLIFLLDGEERIATIDSIKNNRYVKFRFVNEDEKPKDNDTLEFRLEINELTQSVFVRVEEYTETDDLEESYQIWDNLLAQLKEIIGA